MLDRLERANLFLVRLDDDWYWYRYHHLFGKFLRAHLESTRPTAAPALHARAAAWFEQAGMINEAVRHAAAAGDLARAADLVIRHAPMHFMRSEVASVHAWLDLLPPALLQTRPQLGVTRAWALAHDYRVEEAEQALATVAQVLAAHPTVVPDDERLGIEGEVAAIRAGWPPSARRPAPPSRSRGRRWPCCPPGGRSRAPKSA